MDRDEDRRANGEDSDEEREPMVAPPRDTGSKSARARQAKAVQGATGELAEDDGLLQTNEFDRGNGDDLAEAVRRTHEDEEDEEEEEGEAEDPA